jgi:hypothetical protein
MKAIQLIFVVSVSCILILCVGLTAGHVDTGNRKPSIEGSYMLDYRELPDGRKARAPEIIGMMTFTKDHRNFNIYWTENGKPCSLSMISKYTLSDTEYTEDNIYDADNATGKGVSYDVVPSHGKSDVTSKGGGFEFTFPLHSEPKVVLDDNGFTATRKGVFVDHWKKID